MRSRLTRLYARAVNALSFSGELYKMRRELNARIDEPASRQEGSFSDAAALRWFRRRRIGIAEAYIAVIRDLDSGSSHRRLRALAALLDASLRTKALEMPLNTARVQLALMKEAIKRRSDYRAQLEMLADFSSASHGQPRTIRRLLERLDLVELPESGGSMRNLDAGWDEHVHDSSGAGRKNPTQLVIDAFIKGISRLTVHSGGILSLESMEEALEAARMLGIDLRLGIETGVDFEGDRFHFSVLLPALRTGAELRCFFKIKRHILKPFLVGLEEDQLGRIEALRRALSSFNREILPGLNAGFEDFAPCRMPKLRMRSFAEFAPARCANRQHLGEFLWRYYKPVMFNRVLFLKVERGRLLREARRDARAAPEAALTAKRYAEAREEYRSMSPESLRRRFFPAPEGAEHQSAFDNLDKLKAQLERSDCGLRLLTPLEHGLVKALRFLDAEGARIDEVELYNLRKAAARATTALGSSEIAELCSGLSRLNERRMLHGLKPLRAVCGSDATGRDPELPGMGFIRADFLRGPAGRRYRARHEAVPSQVAALVLGRGEDGRGHPGLLCMGRRGEVLENRIGDEEDRDPRPIAPARALRYINPRFANAALITVGFVVAERVIGFDYACLWLGITALRTLTADLLAYRGLRFRQWSLKSVNFDNTAQALFWTGLSVPLLGFVKSRFDALWPFADSGAAFDLAKFFVISFANGLYLAAHNYIRGFNKRVIAANFFRSVISWPFAALSAPIAGLVGIPSIVHAKLWSDAVGGFIEGGNKYIRTLRLRGRDLASILPRIARAKKDQRTVAVFDLLYLFREEPRTRDSLALLLKSRAPRLAGLATPTLATNERRSALEDRLAARIRAVLLHKNLQRRLLDYALSRHANEAAVDLVNLASETLLEFRDWLGEGNEDRAL